MTTPTPTKKIKLKTSLEALAAAAAAAPQPEKITRLNYIGSKYQLLDWLTATIQEKTGWTNFRGKRVADLFAGTGVVSYHFRKAGAQVQSNDAELYSSIITRAFTTSTYTPKCQETIARLNAALDSNAHASTEGYITTHYSPHGAAARKFFTVDNARRIDFLRVAIEELLESVSAAEYTFLLASLIISADAVSNVPAVYGCFLKEFKDKAKKALRLAPIHTLTVQPVDGSRTHNLDVLSQALIGQVEADMVYLDPPYNERQYSKNYFPLNIISKTPAELTTEPPLKGKTGIPTDCFLSPFCKKGAPVAAAFETLCRDLRTEWLFISYNSESLLPKEKMLEIMGKYGTASVVERDYKRFKSFEYNADTAIKEYLFCLHKGELRSARSALGPTGTTP